MVDYRALVGDGASGTSFVMVAFRQWHKEDIEDLDHEGSGNRSFSIVIKFMLRCRLKPATLTELKVVPKGNDFIGINTNS